MQALVAPATPLAAVSTPLAAIGDVFSLPFVQRGVAEVLLLAVGAGLLGTWIVLRGLAFYSHAVGTAAFPGLVVADGLGFAAPIGAFAAAALFAAAVGRLADSRRRGYDVVTALILVGALALGVILASNVFHSGANVETLLFGSLLVIDAGDLALAGATSALAMLATLALGRTWLASGFDADATRAIGMRSRAPDLILFALIALATVAALSAVGALLVSALFVVPAATVRLWTRRMLPWQIATVVLVAVEGGGGLWVSGEWNAPPGGAGALLAGGGVTAAVRLRGAGGGGGGGRVVDLGRVDRAPGGGDRAAGGGRVHGGRARGEARPPRRRASGRDRGAGGGRGRVRGGGVERRQGRGGGHDHPDRRLRARGRRQRDRRAPDPPAQHRPPRLRAAPRRRPGCSRSQARRRQRRRPRRLGQEDRRRGGRASVGARPRYEGAGQARLRSPLVARPRQRAGRGLRRPRRARARGPRPQGRLHAQRRRVSAPPAHP